MPTQIIRQTMFTAGEADEQVFKRTDIESYLTAAQSLKNMECGSTALAKKRRGTRFLLNVSAFIVPFSQMYEFVDKLGYYYLIISGNSNAGISSPIIIAPNVNLFAVYFVEPSDNSLTFVQYIVADTNTNPIPYTPADLFYIDYTQDNDNLILTITKYPQARIFISTYNADPRTNVFSYEVLNIYPLPAYDFNTIDYNNFTVTMSSTGTGSPGDTLTFIIAGVGAGSFTTAWIGGQIVGAGQNVTQPIGYAIITNVVPGVNTATFTATIQIPFLNVTGGAPITSIGSQFSIRQPAWSSTLGYPAAVAFYQNRLWFAATIDLPSTVFGSKVNQPANFDVGVQNDGDAIIYAIGQNDTGKILWLNGGKQLEIYTENYEFACPQDASSGITPSQFSVRQQSSFGAYNVLKPVTYLNDSYFASKTGTAFINFHFDGIGLTYKASNISLSSQHLVKQPINRALQRGQSNNQDNFIYFVNDFDQTITSFQFLSEFKLAALTPIVFAQSVDARDIVTVNNNIYVLKQYITATPYTIEIFDDDYRMDAVQTKTVAPFSTLPPLGIVTGLTDYISFNVHFVYQGQDFGVSLDINGNPAPVDNTGTAYVYNPVFPLSNLTGSITVGILYDNNIIPMYLFAGALQSNYSKAITKIYVDYYQSLDFQVDGVQVPFQFFYNPMTMTVPPPTPLTDTFIADTVDGWNMFNTFSITQSSPFDLQILGIAYQIDAKII